MIFDFLLLRGRERRVGTVHVEVLTQVTGVDVHLVVVVGVIPLVV